MSKTLISVLVVGVLVVGGYFAFKNKGGEQSPIVSDSNQVETIDSGKKMAFSEFVKQGGAYKCEVKQSLSDFENNGTVYLSGDKVMGEWTTVAEGRTMDTNFIVKDGYSYTWSSMMPNMGFKVKVHNESEVNENGDATGTYSWNASQIGDYNCEPWAEESAKFVLPAGITFKEMAEVN